MSALVIGELPALPLHEAGKYVAGAYIVLFAIVLVYVSIMAIRLSRIERELGELLACAREGELAEPSNPGHPGAQEPEAAEPESTLA